MDSNLLVLVDFWAEWCMSCKMIEPVVDEIAKEDNGKLKICSLNVDHARQIASDYGIMSIPFLEIFKDGQLVNNVIGAVSKEAIVNKGNPFL